MNNYFKYRFAYLTARLVNKKIEDNFGVWLAMGFIFTVITLVVGLIYMVWTWVLIALGLTLLFAIIRQKWEFIGTISIISLVISLLGSFFIFVSCTMDYDNWTLLWKWLWWSGGSLVTVGIMGYLDGKDKWKGRL